MIEQLRLAADRFWSKVKVGEPGECWEWTASTAKAGYGQFMFKGQPRCAHRVAKILNTGEWPDSSVFACHKCDNPSCCNPDHLFWGTSGDNARDAAAKGRMWHPPKTQMVRAHAKLAADFANGKISECAKFSADEVRDMRARYAGGESQTSIARSYLIRQSVVQKIVTFTAYRGVK
jgi:hypothetical protein